MRRILSTIAGITLALSLSACGNEPDHPEALTGPWDSASQSQRDSVCEGYLIDSYYSAQTLADVAGVTIVEASDFLFEKC